MVHWKTVKCESLHIPFFLFSFFEISLLLYLLSSVCWCIDILYIFENLFFYESV